MDRAPQAFPNGNFQAGMTLRDWFAGQALPAIIAAVNAGTHRTNGDEDIVQFMASDAYDLADAMLRQRSIDNGAR